MNPSNPQKRALRKAFLISVVRGVALYLSYHHLIVPKGGIISREMQQGLWTSLKNAWKMGRLTAHTAAGRKIKTTPAKKPAFPTKEKAGDRT